MTINVTNAVGANNTIVLDGSSKIPAFDGSLVTALSATAFTTDGNATDVGDLTQVNNYSAGVQH